MNWFISFNTHAFIKSNRYTEKLLHSESMQTGIVLYPPRFFSFVLFSFLSLSLSLSLSRFRLFSNPPPHRKSAEIRGKREPPRRLHCRRYSRISFFFSFFCSDFCLINTRIEDRAAEKRTADIAAAPTRTRRRDDENFPLDTASPMRCSAVARQDRMLIPLAVSRDRKFERDWVRVWPFPKMFAMNNKKD